MSSNDDELLQFREDAEPAAVDAAEPGPPHVIVVGGGIAGLVSARELVRAGIRVTLFEASDHLGGKVARHIVGGIDLDAGAESFATRGSTVADLVTELGLGDAIVAPAAGGAWLQPVAGPARPLPAAGLLGIPSVPLARDVIAIVGLPGALRAQLDPLMSGFVGSKERSFGRIVRRRMGRAVLERLVTPVASAIHSAHPDDLDVDVVAPRLRTAILSEGSLARAVLTLREAAPAGSAAQGIEGGMFRIVDALAAELAAPGGLARVVTGARVTGIGPGEVTLADGATHLADRVVVATELGEPTGVPITLATIVVAVPALDSAPRGTGVLVAEGAPGVQARALTHSTAKWAWLRERANDVQVLRLSYQTAPATSAGLREQARTDAAHLLGVPIPAESVVAFDRIEWRGPGSAHPPPDGVIRVGECVAGAGLAAVIGQARRECAALIGELDGAVRLRLDTL